MDKSKFRPAMTLQAEGRGMSWQMPPNAEQLGLPDAVLNAKDGPIASVVMEQSQDGMVAEVGTFGSARRDLKGNYPTLEEGMLSAESWAVREYDIGVALSKHVDVALQLWANASKDFYARLAETAERKALLEQDQSIELDR